MKYQFKSSMIVEATSEEDALRAIGGHLLKVARHVSEEKNSVSNTETLFTLDEVGKGEPVDLEAYKISAVKIEKEK